VADEHSVAFEQLFDLRATFAAFFATSAFESDIVISILTIF